MTAEAVKLFALAFQELSLKMMMALSFMKQLQKTSNAEMGQ
jgi:hypothetical protein